MHLRHNQPRYTTKTRHALPFKFAALRGLAAMVDFSPRTVVDWSSVLDLGMVPDQEIATRLGISQGAVWKRRVKLGIPAFRPEFAQKGIDWDAQPLGQVTDDALAYTLGVEATVVRMARTRRGIKAHEPRKDTDWTRIPLGVIPDVALANLIGMSQQAVTTARRAAELPPGKIPYFPSKYKDQIWPFIDWTRFPLGKMSDRRVAKQLRVPVSWIRQARAEMSLEPCLKPAATEVAWLGEKCDCGQRKTRHLVACDDCIRLDNLDIEGVAGAILSELRVMGPSTMPQLCRALGWAEDNPGNGKLMAQLNGLAAEGRLRVFTDDDDVTYYAGINDVGRDC